MNNTMCRNEQTGKATAEAPRRRGGAEQIKKLFSPLCILCVLCASAVSVFAAPPEGIERVPLYPEGAPGVVQGEDKDTDPTAPTIDIYVPRANANGAAVVVLPGGGYGNLAMDHEGKQVGEFFNRHGIAAFVTRYRHAPRYRHPIPMNDAQRAIQWVRANAQKFGVDPKRIGVLGFSAGGHLASTVSTKFNDGDPAATDPVARVSSRPDWAVLCYPVITFTQPTMHSGSRKNLLGDRVDDAELVKSLSSELQVSERTPPTFLFHTNEDTGVPPENSVLYYLALREKKVPAELHIFRPGRHGLGLALNNPQVAPWSGLIIPWLDGLGMLK